MKLCKRDDLKTQLGITDAAQDDTLDRLIEAASNDFVNEIRRPDFSPAEDYTEWPRRIGFSHERDHGHREIEVFLKHYPVNKIIKVTFDDVELAALTDPSEAGPGYWFDDEADDEDRQKIVLIGVGATYYGPRRLKVEYNAGYDVIPATVTQAVVEWAAQRHGVGQVQALDLAGGSVTIGTFSESGDNVDMAQTAVEAEMPANVARAVEQYRRL